MALDGIVPSLLPYGLEGAVFDQANFDGSGLARGGVHPDVHVGNFACDEVFEVPGWAPVSSRSTVLDVDLLAH